MKQINCNLTTLLLLIITTTTSISCVFGEQAKYYNYRVYSLNIENENQLEQVQTIGEKRGYDFWQPPLLGRAAEVMIAPHLLPEFIDLIETLKIDYTIKINDVQELIDNEQSEMQSRALTWARYSTLDEIYEWLDEILVTHSDVLEPILIGTSYQGRPIRGVKLSYKAGNPTIFLESNIHAREWITSATATWFLNELLTSTDPEVVFMAQNIDWYIMPVFNVDGFVYTHEVDRMWRKTRQNHATICYGTDANRNFGYEWLTVGASNDPCSQTFAGPAAFSEPETIALANFIANENLGGLIQIYIAFHSYGQYLLFPWGHSTEILTPTHQLQMDIANVTVDAIRELYGTNYVYGTSSAALYATSGTSVDYFYSQYDNIQLGYTFEFRDQGSFGFVLPANQILPNCEEIMNGMKTLIARSYEEGVLVNTN